MIQAQVDEIVTKHKSFIAVIPNVIDIWYAINDLPAGQLIKWAIANGQKLDVVPRSMFDSAKGAALRCNVKGLPGSCTMFLRSMKVDADAALDQIKTLGIAADD